MNRPVFQATNEGKAARNTDECSLTQWRLVPEFSERRRGERENLQLAARAVVPFLCVGYVCKEISWVLSCSHFIIWHPVMRCCERRCWSADVRTCSTGTSMCAFTKTQTALHGAHLGVFAVATLRACCTAQSFRQLVASHLNMSHFHFLNSYAQMLERSVHIYISATKFSYRNLLNRLNSLRGVLYVFSAKSHFETVPNNQLRYSSGRVLY